LAWQLVESVVKEPGMVWKQKAPHEISDQVRGLFFMVILLLVMVWALTPQHTVRYRVIPN
jgi:hypothetical protein